MLAQITVIALIAAALWQGWRSYRAWQVRRRAEEYAEWKVAQRYVLLKVLVPKNNEKTPLAAEQMFAAIHGIFRDGALFQEQVSFELAAYEKFIHFYVHVPQHLKEFVEGQIYAQYPNVEISEAEDYILLLNASQPHVAAELVLTKDDVYPIQTFPNFTVDPLSGITAVLGNLGSGEQLWIQIIAKPISENWQAKGVNFVAAKRAGVSTHRPALLPRILGSVGGLLADFIRTALQPASAGGGEGGGETSGGEEKSKIQLSAPEEAALKGIETKVTKLGFATKIRFLASAADSYTAQSRIEALTGAFKQFNTTNLNGFRSTGLTTSSGALGPYRARDFADEGYVLNTEELASLYHLPAVTVETPNIAWAGSKKGEPPANLPLEGQADTTTVTYFGTTDFRNFRHKFGIKLLDRRLHIYTIGKTGTGKSTLLMNMIIDDIAKGRGVGVVDPHGQLINDVMERIPSHRINDVIYFNPADRDFPIGFNVLDRVDPDLRNVVASGVVSIFKKLFADSWGPRLEYILRNVVIALLNYPESTLLGINRLLVDPGFRRRVIRKVDDPVIRDFFENEYERYDPKFQREAIAPIQNKVGQFLSSATIRNIVGQPTSAFDMRQVMDSGKILLMDLSIGRIGEDNAALLGAMLITKVQLAAMSRADTPDESQRRDFYLYIDEFQNFATESFAVILSEARKYHLNLVLTNQYIAQMPEEVAHAVFGNVGTMVSFRVGAGDATGLVKEFEPVFEAIDLVNLDNHHIYVKMAIDGVTRPAFSAKTLPPVEPLESDNIEKIVRVSRERFAKPREFVTKKIQDWADDVQVKQAQEWRRGLEEKEQTGAVPAAQFQDDRRTPKPAPTVPDRSQLTPSAPRPTASAPTQSTQRATPAAQPAQRRPGGNESSRGQGRGRRDRGGQRDRRDQRGAPRRGQSVQPQPRSPVRPANTPAGNRPSAPRSAAQPDSARGAPLGAEQGRPSSVPRTPPAALIRDEDIESLRQAAEGGYLSPGQEISIQRDDRDRTPPSPPSD